jgi:hypothetical protein
VAFAIARPHGVGYVEQPLATRATYTVTASSSGSLTVRNLSDAPLLVTVDLGAPASLAPSSSLAQPLPEGVHVVSLTATTSMAQTYALDGIGVSW